MINYLKVALIRLADIINALFDPFEQASFYETTDLDHLEGLFWEHLQTNHVKAGSFKYELPMPQDYGDYALFQGLYTGLAALKGVGVEEAVKELDRCFISGILIRGFRAGGTPNDTTSNDSATGVLFGLYAVKKYTHIPVDHIIKPWAKRIIQANYALTDLAGKPTKYGKLEDGIKTDPLRITLLLAILALAGEHDHFAKIYDKYEPLLKYPKVSLLWLDTDYDTHRAAIHLHILWALTSDDLYIQGMKRLLKITRKQNNVWVNVLCAPASTPVNLSLLHTFKFNFRVRGTVESINSHAVDSVKWGKKVRAKQVLPIYLRGSQEFYWQRNMFSLDEWAGQTTPHAYHSGLDYLLVYWLAKRMGN